VAPSAPDGGHPYLITATLLDQLRWDDPDIYAIYLGPAAHNHGITTRVRVAAFLAQVGHESGGGRHRREIASGAAYEGRRDLGNTQPGDGRRFRGRGLIQITGRANTTRARDALKPGMEIKAFCEWLEEHGGASVSAAWWWNQHGCNALADSGDFIGLTRRINGGVNGLGDRQARWAAAKRALGV
jgi:putative chitinase